MNPKDTSEIQKQVKELMAKVQFGNPLARVPH